MESKKKVDVSAYSPVQIPTNQMFLTRWYAWTNKKVLSHFKRDRERALDTVQNVRLRLLSKDFIGRWFFKHLKEDLVDLAQAEYIFGGASIKTVPELVPVVGNRGDSDSLYRISDLLNWSHFDYKRYYYSIQNHTIDSDKVLELLGYEPGRYSALQSMFRQGKLLPSELTEHSCTGPSCDDCIRGKETLRKRRVSLADNWTSPESRMNARKLRWNDAQLRPYLRDWRSQNTVKNVPNYIMRPLGDVGIDAGLLKYAEIVIKRTVVNDFKSLSRSDDLSLLVMDGRKNPEYSDSEALAWEGDEDHESNVKIIRDMNALQDYKSFETSRDVNKILGSAILTANERRVIEQVDFGEQSIREVAQEMDLSAVRVNKIRQNAIEKMSDRDITLTEFLLEVRSVAERYGIKIEDVLDRSKFGPQVLARAQLFGNLYDSGFSLGSLAQVSGRYESEITASINKSLYM